jgi:hypothetical protein
MLDNLRSMLTTLVTGEKPYLADTGTPEQDERDSVQKWTQEMGLARKFVEKWHTQGDKTQKRYIDERDDALNGAFKNYRLNLFHSNIQTMKATMYAKLPKVEADRRFLDPNDDVARVAGEMLTRILQNDLNKTDNTLNDVLKESLEDRLVPGLGVARVRYCMEEGDDPNYVAPEPAMPGEVAPEVPQVKTSEWCEEVYVHWKDILWNPCRTYSELRWKAFRSYMDKDEITERFGADIAEGISYTSNGPKLNSELNSDIAKASPQAEIWEIWDKPSKSVYWYCKGQTKFLDKQDDPMQLEGFFPDARWMIANTTTAKLLPKADFAITQDLYDEIDILESRIALLTSACKVVGVYDRSSKEIGRMLTEGVENQLIPVDNWAMFAERGGMKGMTDWLPIQQVAEVIQVLAIQQQSRIQQLYQITGMSDIMRGQASTAGTTATEQRIKAQFGSLRIQALQDEFARFASDLLNKKAQIIQRFYDPETIFKLSNIGNTPDAPLAQQAIALLKDHENFNMRIAVRAESMAQIDYDQLREERTGFLQATAQFMGMAAPLLQQNPESAPFLMQLLQFGVSGFKASSEMEGIIDQAIAAQKKAAEVKAQQPPQPSPEEKKMQAEQQLAQQQQQMDQQQAQQESQLKAQQAQQDMALEQQKSDLQMQKLQADIAQGRQEFALQMQQMREEHALKMQEIQAKLQATVVAAQAKADAQEEPSASAP